jgi:hypothetical protein
MTQAQLAMLVQALGWTELPAPDVGVSSWEYSEYRDPTAFPDRPVEDQPVYQVQRREGRHLKVALSNLQAPLHTYIPHNYRISGEDGHRSIEVFRHYKTATQVKRMQEFITSSRDLWQTLLSARDKDSSAQRNIRQQMDALCALVPSALGQNASARLYGMRVNRQNVEKTPDQLAMSVARGGTFDFNFTTDYNNVTCTLHSGGIDIKAKTASINSALSTLFWLMYGPKTS